MPDLLQDNIATLRPSTTAQVDGGVIYHYYWFRDQAKTKEISANTALHYFRNQDPGRVRSISGGGVLESSKKKDQAQQFLTFVTSKAGQEVLEKGTSFEYPVASGVPANPALVPLATAGARRQPVGPRRAEGHRPDDEGGPALGGRRRDRGRTPSARPSARDRRCRARAGPGGRRHRRARWSPRRSSRSATSPGRWSSTGPGAGLRTRRAAAGRRTARQHRRPGRASRCRSASCSGSAPPGWWSAPTCRGAAVVAPAVRRAARRARVHQQLRVGQRRARRCTASAQACWWRRCPTSRSSTCPLPPRCAGSIPPSRNPPARSVPARRACSAGWCCRSCGWPSSAAAC